MARSKTLTIGAVGDIGFKGSTADAVAQNGFAWPFESLQPIFDQADVLFGNMESMILPEDYPDEQIDPAGMISKLDTTPSLMAAGFDIMNLAQNHLLDGGTIGMFHTARLLKDSGIVVGGVGRTQKQARKLQVIERDGLRIGMLAYCEDNNWILSARGAGPAYYSEETVLADVAAARDKVDVLIVSIHGDLEFMETPSTPRRDSFRRIADAGATLVLGHHPHVPQGIEMRRGRLVAYSLGNCYFAAHSSDYMKENGPHTGHSFVLLAKVRPGKVVSFERVPFEIRKPPNERPVLLGGARRERMLKYFDKLDAACKDDAHVARVWREFSIKMFDIYLERIRTMPREKVWHDLIGRLGLVAENRSWMTELLAAVREDWEKRATGEDELHRPHYALTATLERLNGGAVAPAKAPRARKAPASQARESRRSRQSRRRG
jgi:poly-gamma-glutamate synthesis protein (capsule biosynthesis protein)